MQSFWETFGVAIFTVALIQTLIQVVISELLKKSLKERSDKRITALQAALQLENQNQIEKLKTELQRESNRLSEELKWETKTREQGAKVAEYFAMLPTIPVDGKPEEYVKFNQHVFELALWLPETTYRAVTQGVHTNNETHNLQTGLLAARQALLGKEAGNLVVNDLMQHLSKSQLDQIRAHEAAMLSK